MLITFERDGSVEFTRNPELLALFPDDHKRIVRMSDIRFDDTLQAYYIHFLTGPFAGLNFAAVDDMLWHDFVLSGRRPEECQGARSPSDVLVFRTYEQAVCMEVAYIDFLRECGYSFK